MSAQKILGGAVHPLPVDLRRALGATPKALGVWGTITPLARSE